MSYEYYCYGEDEEELDYVEYQEDLPEWWKFWVPVGIVLLVAVFWYWR